MNRQLRLTTPMQKPPIVKITEPKKPPNTDNQQIKKKTTTVTTTTTEEKPKVVTYLNNYGLVNK